MNEPDQLALNLARLKEIVGRRAGHHIDPEVNALPLPVVAIVVAEPVGRTTLPEERREQPTTAPPNSTRNEIPQRTSFFKHITRIFGWG